jgi:hypothetical protein
MIFINGHWKFLSNSGKDKRLHILGERVMAKQYKKAFFAINFLLLTNKSSGACGSNWANLYCNTGYHF